MNDDVVPVLEQYREEHCDAAAGAAEANNGEVKLPMDVWQQKRAFLMAGSFWPQLARGDCCDETRNEGSSCGENGGHTAGAVEEESALGNNGDDDNIHTIYQDGAVSDELMMIASIWTMSKEEFPLFLESNGLRAISTSHQDALVGAKEGEAGCCVDGTCDAGPCASTASVVADANTASRCEGGPCCHTSDLEVSCHTSKKRRVECTDNEDTETRSVGEDVDVDEHEHAHGHEEEEDEDDGDDFAIPVRSDDRVVSLIKQITRNRLAKYAQSFEDDVATLQRQTKHYGRPKLPEEGVHSDGGDSGSGTERLSDNEWMSAVVRVGEKQILHCFLRDGLKT
eukprot:TRINITY_DN2649_c0_g1_i3.p1 TRINITY_DN2649_c0_g1~~TRINITY_DN2649_c0_g1_i3.p1  ORF type:complete len:339 (-),score=63.16 TRINITY_DN2649_c0_g1_i3:50-1066(-)